MAGLFNPVNEWTIRAVVLLSLGAHVVLTLFAGIRRRESSGWRTVVLWLAYQVSNWAAAYALSNLSLGRTRDQQLGAFWVPFLLMHLGGPDNITAYSLDDNKLSLRQAVNTVLQVLGTSFVVYRQVYISGKGTMLWASVVMVAIGVAKYFEKAWALRAGDFGNIRSSGQRQQISLRIQQHRRSKLNSEKALLVAHDLLHVSKGAFADYSVDEDPLKRDTNVRILFSHGWENMCRVVEMELSLMYDILYTKAAVAHTWLGYLIRVASPAATATVTLLFWLSNKDDQQREDVLITYVLLVSTFLLDVTWLIRATASTWTYAFLNARPASRLHHALLCSGRWYRLRLVVMSLDPRRLLLIREPIGRYRLWSGTIGQYNLLHECTHERKNLFRWLVKKVATEETLMEYQYSRSLELDISKNVKKLLFDQIREALNLAYPASKPKKGADEKKKKEEEQKKPDDAAFKRQRLILIWHVATDIFLSCSDRELFKDDETVDAITALSNYMLFLVAVRPDMLPGLKLRSLYHVTRQALDNIWKKHESSRSSRRRDHSSSKTRDHELASILQDKEKQPADSDGRPGYRSVLYSSSIILSDGAKIADVLQARLSIADWDRIVKTVGIKKDSEKRILLLIPELGKGPVLKMGTLLKLIFNSWIRMLVFVSTRCSRDSHAKQLGRGCELTTIVWILAEHAGIFHI